MCIRDRLVGIGLLSFVPYLAWVYVAYRQGGQPFLDLVLEENTCLLYTSEQKRKANQLYLTNFWMAKRLAE